MKNLVLLLAFSLLLVSLSLIGQDIPEPMSPPRLVNDFAGILTAGQVRHLEQKLVNFDDSSSSQILVLTVKSLNGLTKEEFADRVGEKWGVGQKGKNNGVVVLVKPRYGNERGQVRISVGYGLEGAIPDALTKRITENDMIPYFKAEDYFTGIDKATTTLIALAKGEYTADEYKKNSGGDISANILVPIIIIIIIIIFLSRNSGKHYTSGSKTTSIWTALWLASMMSNRGGHGSWGDFRSGGGSFGGWGGGSSGGGFGGFGGGSFGGGGAGGSW
jgi:uncharacterized protein